MSAHVHTFERIGIDDVCACGRVRFVRCNEPRPGIWEQMQCARPINHLGRHRANGYEWGIARKLTEQPE